MDFSDALRAIKSGKRVSRSGWNGKGMWIFFMPGYPDGMPANVAMAVAKAGGIADGATVRVLPCVMMKTATGEFVPWLASQTDLLTEDWSITDGS